MSNQSALISTQMEESTILTTPPHTCEVTKDRRLVTADDESQFATRWMASRIAPERRLTARTYPVGKRIRARYIIRVAFFSQKAGVVPTNRTLLNLMRTIRRFEIAELQVLTPSSHCPQKLTRYSCHVEYTALFAFLKAQDFPTIKSQTRSAIEPTYSGPILDSIRRCHPA
jgi:hypothetical protein